MQTILQQVFGTTPTPASLHATRILEMWATTHHRGEGRKQRRRGKGARREGRRPALKGQGRLTSRGSKRTSKASEAKEEQQREVEETARCTTGALSRRARPKGGGAVH